MRPFGVAALKPGIQISHKLLQAHTILHTTNPANSQNLAAE